MIKISLYTTNADILHKLEAERIFDIEVNCPTSRGDICIADCSCLSKLDAKIFRPCVAIVNSSNDNVPFECDYVLQAPFEQSSIARIFGFIGEENGNPVGNLYKISKLLRELGMEPKLTGFLYAVYAVEMYIENNGVILLKDICMHIAGEKHTTPAAVERAMRIALEKTWQYGDLQRMYDLFGNSIDPNKGKPSNSEFVARIAQYFMTGV